MGNVEGRDLLTGTADVVVTDGFTGNVALKVLEGCASALFGRVKEAARSGLRAKLGGMLLRPALRGPACGAGPGGVRGHLSAGGARAGGDLSRQLVAPRDRQRAAFRGGGLRKGVLPGWSRKWRRSSGDLSSAAS